MRVIRSCWAAGSGRGVVFLSVLVFLSFLMIASMCFRNYREERRRATVLRQFYSNEWQPPIGSDGEPLYPNQGPAFRKDY